MLRLFRFARRLVGCLLIGLLLLITFGCGVTSWLWLL